MLYFYSDREVNQKHGACVYYSSFRNWYYDVKNDDIWCENFTIFPGKLSIKNSEPKHSHLRMTVNLLWAIETKRQTPNDWEEIENLSPAKLRERRLGLEKKIMEIGPCRIFIVKLDWRGLRTGYLEGRVERGLGLRCHTPAWNSPRKIAEICC